MNKLILAALVSVFAVNVALAQAPTAKQAGAQASAAKGGRAAQQKRMKTCNKEATGKKGDERKAFMKKCLSGGKK